MFSYIFFPLLFIPTVLFRNLFVKDAIPCRYYRVVRSSGMHEVVVLHDMNIVTLFQNYPVRFMKCMAKYTTRYPPNEPIFMYDDITNVLMCTLRTTNADALVEELEKDHALVCVHDEYMDYVDELEDSRSNISEESGLADEASYDDDDDEYEKVQQQEDDEEDVTINKSTVTTLLQSKYIGDVYGVKRNTIFEAISAVKRKVDLFRFPERKAANTEFFIAKMQCRYLPNPTALQNSSNDHAVRYLKRARLVVIDEDAPDYVFEKPTVQSDYILYKNETWYAVIVQATDSHIGDENDDIEEIEANENDDKKDQ